MRHFRFSQFTCLLRTGLIASIGIPSLATAQQPQNETGLQQADEIEHIVVYAQKRPQQLNDVSVSISVFDSQFIENRQLKDTTQLAPLVPNFKITNNAGEGTPPAFNLRGVGMIDYNTSSVSPIAVYSDDVVSGSANNLSANLFDLEQVEVLRGPQGTLFGRNTTGGAILLRSAMPGSEFEGYAKASVAEHQHKSFDAAVSLPVNQNFSNRIALNYEDYEFSINNQFPGAPNGGLRQTNLRWIGQYQNEAIQITTKLTSENWRGAPKPIESAGILDVANGGQCSPNRVGTQGCADAFGFFVDSDDYWDTSADTNDRLHDTESWSASLKLVWQINAQTTFTSITAKRDMERFHSWDSDGPGNFIEGSMGTDNDLTSQEFSVAVEKGQYHWITGLYFLNEEILQNNDIDLFRDFRQVPGLEAIPAQFFYNNRLENESKAVFSQLDWELSNHFTLTTGLRFTDESTTYRANADLDTVAAVIPNLWDLSGKIEDSEWSGKLALVQRLENGNSIFYSYSRGYKSGGYNAGYATSPAEAADSEYRPESLNAYELGFRLQAWENKFWANISSFYYDYHDQQVFINVSQSVSPYDVLRNAGDSTIYGLESEMWLQPNKNWRFNLNIGYIPKAEIGDYVGDGVSVSAAQMPFTSKWNISGNAFYQRDWLDGQFKAELGFDYQSEFYFDQNENPYTRQEGYTLWHGRVAYGFDGQWELGLWGKNIFNQEYAELRFDSIAALAAVTELKGEKRQVGIELSYQF